MRHHLPYFGDDAALYNIVLLKLFQKYPPPSSGFSITILETGKAGGAFTSRYRPPDMKSIHETAKLVAGKIAGECKSHTGRAFKGVALDF
jgi:hypothetical protein